jgi:hypothetical protein
MIRLRSSAASARQARGRFATAWQATINRACATVAFVVIAGSSSVFACPMCFGAEETHMVDGTKLGILAMLAITIAVQGGFVGFFLYLRKRAKLNAELELDTEWSELQKPSRT